MEQRAKITLTGTPETLLATLYSRALDARSRDPVLGDEHAVAAVRRIDYDFRRTGINAVTATGVALRAKLLDDWLTAFLADHEEATVLHLACGLDTRARRLARPATVRWFDVDLPEVIELRERLLPPPGGDYTQLAASVTEQEWLERVPADRPAVAVFEGLAMYLREEDGRRLIERITGRFPSGELLFDVYGTMGIRMQKLVPAVRRTGARMYWGVDDPRVIESWHDGLVCVDAVRSVDMPGLERLPLLSGRLPLWVLARIPRLRDVGRILRFRYEGNAG
ncbi:class I SAM-dependent methyltransferase [Nonomuraea sp. NPDC003804]|uniref:class I SAM-dependent methyltransferase n=1 Tax=Nonomuraea sp. NPDC003804 TaxID=3154547 RepID=UPI00339FE598